MSVWALGLNHTTAPLDLRGRFAFSLDQLAPTLSSLKQALGPIGAESAILSTCNRTEIYLAGSAAHQPSAAHPAMAWLAAHGGVSPQALAHHTYTLRGDQAARHAFRVASGLDSMVLGEPQILGQFKAAVRAADDAGALGSTLNQLFQRSFSVAKDVRTNTELGQASISMAAAAVRLAGQLFEDLAKTSILFVGAGDMIALAAAHFNAKSPVQMVFANRTPARGQALAAQFGASSLSLSEIPKRLHEFDIVISCTASTLPIIGLGAVERAVKLRRRRPMFMVDLAVPRDIEPEVKALDDVYLYSVDDLATLVQAGQATRQVAVAQAEAIVDAGVVGFIQWLDQRASVPLIQQLNAQAQSWREAELERARKSLAKGEDIEAVLQALAKGVASKALHGSYAALASADATERAQAAEHVAKLFLRDKL